MQQRRRLTVFAIGAFREHAGVREKKKEKERNRGRAPIGGLFTLRHKLSQHVCGRECSSQRVTELAVPISVGGLDVCVCLSMLLRRWPHSSEQFVLVLARAHEHMPPLAKTAAFRAQTQANQPFCSFLLLSPRSFPRLMYSALADCFPFLCVCGLCVFVSA